jgi:hypothetical protein
MAACVGDDLGQGQTCTVGFRREQRQMTLVIARELQLWLCIRRLWEYMETWALRTGEVMRRYYVPLTVLGLAGVGVLLFSERGRQALRWIAENVEGAPEAFSDWNDAAQRELDRLQAAVNQLAESLEAAR